MTLNGRDFDGGGVRYSYFGVDALAPTLGPALGGTEIRVGGTYLVHGAPAVLERVCRFGNASHTEVVAASLVGASLRCISPPMPAGAVTRTVSIALDGANYETAPTLRSSRSRRCTPSRPPLAAGAAACSSASWAST